jgi:hypothetical protein
MALFDCLPWQVGSISVEHAFSNGWGFRELLPSYLCACVLWDGIEVEALALTLLAPLRTNESENLHLPTFEFVHQALSSQKRSVVGSFLLYFLADRADSFEFKFGIDKQRIEEAIKKYWGELALITNEVN